jgi:hypothetical protein
VGKMGLHWTVVPWKKMTKEEEEKEVEEGEEKKWEGRRGRQSHMLYCIL